MAVGTRGRKQAAADADTPAFGGIAERFRRAGDLDKAIALCREGLKKFPDQVSGRVTLGWALLDKGKYDEAQVELEYALKRAPDNLAAIRGLAELHERAENTMMLPMDGPGQWPPDAAMIEDAVEAVAEEEPPAPTPAAVVHVAPVAAVAAVVAAEPAPVAYDTTPARYTRASEPEPASNATMMDIDPPMSDADIAALAALVEEQEQAAVAAAAATSAVSTARVEQPSAVLEPEPIALEEPIITLEAEPIIALEAEPIVAAEAEPTISFEAEPIISLEAEQVAPEFEPITLEAITPEAEPIVGLEAEPITVDQLDPPVELAPAAVSADDVERELAALVELTEAAEVTEAAEAPEITEAAEVTEVTEAAELAEAREAAEAAEAAEVAEALQAAEAAEVTEAPEAAEVTEVTEAAEAAEATEVGEVEEVPEAVEVPDLHGADFDVAAFVAEPDHAHPPVVHDAFVRDEPITATTPLYELDEAAEPLEVEMPAAMSDGAAAEDFRRQWASDTTPLTPSRDAEPRLLEFVAPAATTADFAAPESALDVPEHAAFAASSELSDLGLAAMDAAQHPAPFEAFSESAHEPVSQVEAMVDAFDDHPHLHAQDNVAAFAAREMRADVDHDEAPSALPDVDFAAHLSSTPFDVAARFAESELAPLPATAAMDDIADVRGTWPSASSDDEPPVMVVPDVAEPAAALAVDVEDEELLSAIEMPAAAASVAVDVVSIPLPVRVTPIGRLRKMLRRIEARRLELRRESVA